MVHPDLQVIFQQAQYSVVDVADDLKRWVCRFVARKCFLERWATVKVHGSNDIQWINHAVRLGFILYEINSCEPSAALGLSLIGPSFSISLLDVAQLSGTMGVRVTHFY